MKTLKSASVFAVFFTKHSYTGVNECLQYGPEAASIRATLGV